MKKLVLLILGLVLVASLFADVKVYGRVRTGAWYTNYDKDFTGGNSLLKLNSAIYASSRFGASFNYDNFKAKAEIGMKNGNAIFLRLAYGEYNFGSVKVLFGQDFTGFTSKNYSSQAYNSNRSSEVANVKFGAFFDSRHPMLKLTFAKMLYVMFMQPNKVDPAGIGAASIDALFPKVNFGLNYKADNFSISPTFGFNYSKYNKDRNPLEIDDAVTAFAFATSFKYMMDKFCFKAQINYGQNIADYGIKAPANSSAYYDANNELKNSTTMGGFLQMQLNLNNKTNIIVGGGLSSAKNDRLNDADNAMDTFLQANFKISKNFMMTPEVGYINYMEDGFGNKQGTEIYFGSRLQATF